MYEVEPSQEKIWNDYWMTKTPQQRVLFGAALTSFHRKIIIASLPPDLSPNEIKRAIFKRTYGYDLPEDFPFDKE